MTITRRKLRNKETILEIIPSFDTALKGTEVNFQAFNIDPNTKRKIKPSVYMRIDKSRWVDVDAIERVIKNRQDMIEHSNVNGYSND